ncbi:MAG TPA: HPr family phosphocarrier protein [Rhodospirillales bacterium]|jgi:phosphocarrier protein
MTAPDAPAKQQKTAAGSGAADATTVRRRVTIVNERGLHARAAAKFAKTAGAFKAKVTVTKGEYTVSALSIMGLMMLAAAPGSEIDLLAVGADAQVAIEALTALITDKFEEDDTPA